MLVNTDEQILEQGYYINSETKVQALFIRSDTIVRC
jgi:hypothetical protein